MRSSALILAVGLIGCQSWTPKDTALQSVSGTLIATDYMQTLSIAGEGKESNPIIGRHGERSVTFYFMVMLVAHTTLMSVLPKPWRNIAQGITILVEGVNVDRNRRYGF